MGVPLGHDSHYAVLGLRRDADDAVVAAAYRALAKKHHPDLAIGDKKLAAKRFHAIHAAFEVLGDPEKRKLYDASPLFAPPKSIPVVSASHVKPPVTAPKRSTWRVKLVLISFVIIALLKFSLVWFPASNNVVGEWTPPGTQTEDAMGAGNMPVIPGNKFNDRIILKMDASRP